MAVQETGHPQYLQVSWWVTLLFEITLVANVSTNVRAWKWDLTNHPQKLIQLSKPTRIIKWTPSINMTKIVYWNYIQRATVYFWISLDFRVVAPSKIQPIQNDGWLYDILWYWCGTPPIQSSNVDVKELNIIGELSGQALPVWSMVISIKNFRLCQISVADFNQSIISRSG